MIFQILARFMEIWCFLFPPSFLPFLSSFPPSLLPSFIPPAFLFLPASSSGTAQVPRGGRGAVKCRNNAGGREGRAAINAAVGVIRAGGAWPVAIEPGGESWGLARCPPTCPVADMPRPTDRLRDISGARTRAKEPLSRGESGVWGALRHKKLPCEGSCAVGWLLRAVGSRSQRGVGLGSFSTQLRGPVRGPCACSWADSHAHTWDQE